MSAEIMGVPLSRLEDPIRSALRTYQEISQDALVFDDDKASKLVLTPDKPNSARSESKVVFLNGPVEKLYVIAFKPGDGTGSEVDYKLEDLEIDPPYPRDPRIVPRNKTGVHTEVHFTVVSHKIEDVHAEPKEFKGTYDLLGLERNKVKKIGELGHSKYGGGPVVTFTVGYKYYRRDRRDERRFGDPHAVYSAIPDSIQVCAFLAVSNELSRVLNILHPQFPSGNQFFF